MRERTREAAQANHEMVLNADMVEALQWMLSSLNNEGSVWALEVADETGIRRSEIYDYMHTFEYWGLITGEKETYNRRDRRRPARTMYTFTPNGRELARDAIDRTRSGQLVPAPTKRAVVRTQPIPNPG